MEKQICSSQCADGGAGSTSTWCKVAIDNGNIHHSTLYSRPRISIHGGPGSAWVSVRDLNKIYANAVATTDNQGAGCHNVGTPDFAATFLQPEGMAS